MHNASDCDGEKRKTSFPVVELCWDQCLSCCVPPFWKEEGYLFKAGCVLPLSCNLDMQNAM